jgi:tRNA-specific 2-thiouridylase
MAAELGLRTATKQESYEICFVPDDRYDRFLSEKVPDLRQRLSGGEILLDGKVVGHHEGYPFYTVGQRRGIGAYGKKMYVTEIDRESNTVRIGPDDALFRRSLTATGANWMGGDPSRETLRVQAKVRYKDDATSAIVFVDSENTFRLTFDEPKRAITPGQSVVMYDGEVVVGGGIIEAVID